MNRRCVLTSLLALTAAWSAPSLAQPSGKVWRVGFLSLSPITPPLADAFRKAMRDRGYVEGRNLIIEWRDGDGKLERMPSLAAELVQLKVDIILAQASAAIGPAKNATSTIPIVMTTTGDPVGSGFVQSLAHPGGNITGLSNMGGETGAKQVELLVAAIPTLTRIGLLATPTSTTYRAIVDGVRTGARQAGLTIMIADASTSEEIDSAFASLSHAKVEAVIVGAAPLFASQRQRVAELAARHGLPAMFGSRAYVESGGLMSYGQAAGGNYARVATYVDKIFRGAKPGDLPVEQPRDFELVINQKTAKALGLRIPREVLLRANDVIE